MPLVSEVINTAQIQSILTETKNPADSFVEQILAKAALQKGLDLNEVGILLNTDSPALLKKIFQTARQIKESIYGNRLVLFAPLYISNYCENDCEYCAFHARNPEQRKKLTLAEVADQVEILIKMGHKRLLIEFGEHPKNDIDYVTDVIKTIYQTKAGHGEIRRVNVNIAATTEEDYRKLKSAGIGTYQLFQETYHPESYQKFHPRGPKSDYARQLFAHNRAFAAGIDDVGLGVLFGLYDYKFEVLALVSHSQYLERVFHTGPHTISVPRFQPAATVDLDLKYHVSEEELLKIIAILRLSVPYTGMIISTRERPEIRARAFELGISQTSAASRTSPGGYGQTEALAQFQTADHRTLDEVVISILEQGLIPSFCTACYRQGRTGEDFMHIAKPGEIHHLCLPNALLTFQEYLEDYASARTRELGEKMIQQNLDTLKNSPRYQATLERRQRIKNGERDLYF